MTNAKTNIYDRKLRGLFIVDSDEVWSDHHPLSKAIEAFRTELSEIHLVVFVKNKIAHGQQFVQRDGQFFIYQFKQSFFWFRLLSVIATLKFNLTWQTVFRPDFIMSFSESKSALVGYLLANRHHKYFFQSVSAHIIDAKKVSLEFLRIQYLVRRAATLFVPGPETLTLFSRVFAIPPANIAVIQPAIDMTELNAETTKYNFHVHNPQYNFFVSSVIYSSASFSFLLSTYRHVALKYPRTAFVLIVPSSLVARAQHFFKQNRAYGVLVMPQDDKMNSFIAGTNSYIAVAREEDIDISMLTALGLHIPIVTENYGIAKDIFPNTLYREFAVTDMTAQTMASNILKLIEDQRLRTEYALNTKAMFRRLQFNTPEQYAEKIYVRIGEIVRPDLPTIEAA